MFALIVVDESSAVDFNLGSFEGNLDTKVSVNTQLRTQSVDSRLVGTRARSAGDTAPKGSAFSTNNDDGNLNYQNGVFSQLNYFTSALDISNDNIRGFARLEGFYDPLNSDGAFTDHLALSDAAEELVANNVRLLDAYIDFNIAPANIPTVVRVGRHSLNWGEGTFIPGGMNVVNSIDVNQLRTPGGEVRDANLPHAMLSLNISATANTSIEAFYQVEWEEDRIDRPGTFFSTNDFAAEGQDRFIYGFGDFSEFGTDVRTLFGGTAAFNGVNNILNAPLGAGLTGVSGTAYGTLPTVAAFEDDWFTLGRGANNEPGNDGQYGLSFRIKLPEYNDAEFGLYFANYHSRQPIISARTASAANTATAASQFDKLAANGGAASDDLVALNTQLQSSNYFIEYPENIKLLGTSFNTKVGTSNWSMKGEYSIHLNKPLQVDVSELLLASLTPLDTQLRAQTAGNLTTTLTDNQLGTFGTDTTVPGFIERNVSQIQITAVRTLGPMLGANAGLFVTELGVHHVHNMPDKNVLRLSAPGTTTTGNPAQAATGGIHAGKPAEASSHFPDASSWGYRMKASLNFDNAVGEIDLSPRIEWQHDVDGISPGPNGPFLEGRKAVSLGVRTNFRKSWSADMSWTNFFGAGRYNLINDRDFFSASFQYIF